MGKNEIRLRRQRLTASGTDRFRNYGAVLERYEQEKRMKKTFRAFLYVLLLAVLILLFFLLSQWEKSNPPPQPAKTSSSAPFLPGARGA